MGDQGLRRAQRLAIATAGVLLLGALLPAPLVRAADPTRQAQEQVAGELGGTADDFEVVYQRAVSTTVSGGPTWATKLVDGRTGEIHTVYQLTDGSAGSVAAVQEALTSAEAALSPLDRKADAPLRAAVEAGIAAKLLPVAVWLDVDTDGAEAAVR